MKKDYFRSLSIFLIFFLFAFNAQAYWVWSPSEGKFISPETVSETQKTAEDLFQSALKLHEQKGKERDTIHLLQQIVKYHNQSAYAPEAQFLIATIYEAQGKPLRAAAEFKKLVREFPRSQRIEESIEHLFKIGNLFLTGEKQKIMGVAIIPVYSKAVDVFKFIVDQAPYGPYGDQAQLKLGMAYRKMGNFNDAVNAFQTLIVNYPTSSLIDEAHYQLAETSYELSQTASRDQSVATQASLHLKDFIKQYGTSSLAERARLLKQRLDEQDAEKNYRIGLYYEKQGAVESALIYYEDIAEHYSETTFGKKAAQRLKTLQEPIRAMEKGEAAIQRRIAEVQSMLEALEQQEKKGKGKAGVETGDLKNQLKQELASLRLGQKEFRNEARENFATRKRSFAQKQKNLRDKFKNFKNRKKQLLKNPSPELQEVLDKWQASLVAEQEELAHERQTLNEMKRGFKKQKVGEGGRKHLLGWIPHRHAQKEMPVQIARFDQKKWDRFQKERSEITAQRRTNHNRLEQIEVQLKNAEQQEVNLVEAIPNLDQLLPSDLLREKVDLAQKKSELNRSLQTFEQLQKEFKDKFGSAFIETLNNESHVSKQASANSLAESGKDLGQMLNALQTEQTSLSEAWLAKKEELATMAKAVQSSQSGQKQVEEQIVGNENGEGADQVKQARLLKKRMKYLEREIRSRVDQIQDWRRENAKRMRQLNQLLKPQGESKMEKVAKRAFISPARGTYKLTKAFFFGLENNDEKLMQKADSEVKKSEMNGATNERLEEIRELQEEIELQSILIQGRASEVADLETRLHELQKQASTIPGFSYQSLLVERIPTDLAHSVSTAKKLMGLGMSEADILKRLETQSKELGNLEQKMMQNREQAEIVNMAIERKAAIQSNQKPAALPFVSGHAEKLPQEGNGVADEQNQAQTKLIQMKAEVNIRRSGVEQAEFSYREKLSQWYQTTGQKKLGEKTSRKMKDLLLKKSHLQEKKKQLHSSQLELLKKETTVIESQKALTEQKLNELGDRLEKLKNPSDSEYQALMSEIKVARDLHDSLIHDLSIVQSS